LFQLCDEKKPGILDLNPAGSQKRKADDGDPNKDLKKASARKTSRFGVIPTGIIPVTQPRNLYWYPITTEVPRLSFCDLLEPQDIEGGEYRCSIIKERKEQKRKRKLARIYIGNPWTINFISQMGSTSFIFIIKKIVK